MEKGREVISPGHPEDFVLPDLGTAFAEMDEDPRLTEKDKLRRKNELTKQLDETGARLHTTSQLLKAYCIYEKDVEYVVKEGKVIIIDQNTGREMPGRRWFFPSRPTAPASARIRMTSSSNPAVKNSMRWSTKSRNFTTKASPS